LKKKSHNRRPGLRGTESKKGEKQGSIMRIKKDILEFTALKKNGDGEAGFEN